MRKKIFRKKEGGDYENRCVNSSDNYEEGLERY